MAVGATTVWRIRAGGASQNGGGFDPGISGAGTDYTDQDAQVAFFGDATTSGAGSTTLLSATAGFTAAMVGNCARIASGTNFVAGYYFITGYTNATTVTLDRSPTPSGAGATGVGRVGGAFASLAQLSDNSGTINTPGGITASVVPGNVIYLRGAGSFEPATMDYDLSTGYMKFVSGNATAGAIRLIGYNGMPGITVGGLLMYQLSYWSVQGIKFKATGASNGALGIICGASGSDSQGVRDCVFDQNGQDLIAVNGMGAINNWCKNGGSTAAGSYPAFDGTQNGSQYSAVIYDNFIDGWRGSGIWAANGAIILGNIIANCHGTANAAIEIGSVPISITINVLRNSIYNCAADGIKITNANAVYETLIMNNIVSTCGGYGINYGIGTAALNDRTVRFKPDYNCLYSNTSGPVHNITQGPNSVNLDPQFTNVSTKDFSVGTNLKGIGSPHVFLPTTTTAWVDIGAVQRQEAGGAAGMLFIPDLAAA